MEHAPASASPTTAVPFASRYDRRASDGGGYGDPAPHRREFPGWAVTLVITLFSAAVALGAAKVELADKESARDHDADMHRVDLRFQRDSIEHSTDRERLEALMTRVTDIACSQQPHRTYCR